jgi:hypothetical protein
LQAAALNEGLRYKKKLWRENRTAATGVIAVGALGEPSSARSVGSLEPNQSDDH